jgi:uncharacterized alpha-E superfamily protein
LRTDLSGNVERLAGKLQAELHYADIRQILDEGLHAYLTGFLARIYDIGDKVATTFLLPTV